MFNFYDIYFLKKYIFRCIITRKRTTGKTTEVIYTQQWQTLPPLWQIQDI